MKIPRNLQGTEEWRSDSGAVLTRTLLALHSYRLSPLPQFQLCRPQQGTVVQHAPRKRHCCSAASRWGARPPLHQRLLRPVPGHTAMPFTLLPAVGAYVKNFTDMAADEIQQFNSKERNSTIC